jgi:hypothetical protein
MEQIPGRNSTMIDLSQQQEQQTETRREKQAKAVPRKTSQIAHSKSR